MQEDLPIIIEESKSYHLDSNRSSEQSVQSVQHKSSNSMSEKEIAANSPEVVEHQPLAVLVPNHNGNSKHVQGSELSSVSNSSAAKSDRDDSCEPYISSK